MANKKKLKDNTSEIIENGREIIKEIQMANFQNKPKNTPKGFGNGMAIFSNFKFVFPKSCRSALTKVLLLSCGIVAVLLFFVVALLFWPQQKINEALVISSAIVKQNTLVIANGGQVQWSVMVEKNDINSQNYLVKLPRTAKNIKITSINDKQAQLILTGKPVESLSLEQRQQLASERKQNNFLASISDSFGRFFIGSIKDGIQIITDLVNNKIQTTSETKIIDLSSQLDISLTPGNSFDNFVKIDYITDAPAIQEENTDIGKTVTVSDRNEDPQAPMINVLASTTIPKIFKVGQEEKIQVRWKNNENKNVVFRAYDTDLDKYLDYIEWSVPHLSDQEFDVILISKAFRLNGDKQPIEDIYYKVSSQDNNLVTVNNGWLRFTFQTAPDKTKSIDIYAKATNPSQPANIEIYPIYIDSFGNIKQGPVVSKFPAISLRNMYHASLANLRGQTLFYDFKITGSVDIDYVQDAGPGPTPTWDGSESGDLTDPLNWTDGYPCDGSASGIIPVSGVVNYPSVGICNATNITNSGTINGGTFTGVVTNSAGTISGGTFSNAIIFNTSNTTISNATFTGATLTADTIVVTIGSDNAYNETTTFSTTNGGSYLGIDTDPPALGGVIPIGYRYLNSATPTITIVLNKTGDCRAATSAKSYDNMSGDVDCSGDGTVNISCAMPNLGADGTKDIYVACKDSHGNKNSAENAIHLSYILDTVLPGISDLTVLTDNSYNASSFPTISYTCDDSGSGCDPSSCQYSYDNNNWLSDGACDGSSIVAPSEEGEYTLYIEVSDNAGNNGSSYEGPFVYDVSEPTTSANASCQTCSGGIYTFGTSAGSVVTVTLGCDDEVSGCSSILYCVDDWSADDCGPKSSYVSDISFSSNGDWQLGFYSTDNAGNEEEVQYVEVRVNTTLSHGQGTPPYIHETTPVASPTYASQNPTYIFNTSLAGVITYGGSCSSSTTVASAGNNTIVFNSLPVGTYSNCTIVVTNSGRASNTLNVSTFNIEPDPVPGTPTGGDGSSYTPANSNNQTPTKQQEEINQVDEGVAQKVTDFFQKITGGPKEDNTAQIVIPKETPSALQNLKLMSINPLSSLKFNTINTDIGSLMNKIPQFKDTLNALSIDINNIEDVKKVSQTGLYLPGLSKSIGIQSEKTVSLQNLTANQLSKIPTDIIFARSQDGSIDFTPTLSIDNKGRTEQIFNIISGRQVELVLKPKNLAKKITGLIITSGVSVNTKGKELGSNFFVRLFGAALSAANPTPVPKTSATNGLLVQKFNFIEKNQGLFVADITAPITEGQYKVVAVTEYQDQSLLPSEMQFTALVDPEGYVYQQLSNGKLRVEGASVSIYWLNPATEKYELWPSDKYMQKNPVVTDDTGKYSFIVPPGNYYLTATNPKYKDYKGNPFLVQGENTVNIDIELISKNFWSDWFNFRTIVVITLLTIAIIFFIVLEFTYFKNKQY